MISQMIGLVEESPQLVQTIPSRDPGAQMMAVKTRLDALEVLCAGMVELLKTKFGCTEEEIADTIRRADERDGPMDGALGPAEGFCPNCHRKLLTKARRKCLWCGEELPPESTNRPG